MLHISHLTVALDTNPIIRDLSLEIQPNTTHVLMGPNGSGKSTLVLSLMGHPRYEIVKGTAFFGGGDLFAMSVENRARAGLFLVCQYPPAIPGVSVLTFLKESHRMLTGEDISVTLFKDLVVQAFDAVKLDHSFMYRTVHEGFSGGEKKRFEVAQLLLCKPKLAILDEIDSGLDVDALAVIAQALCDLKKNTSLSLLLITHYNRLLTYIEPDVVHIMSQGKLWLSGTKDLAHTIEKQGYDGLLL